MGSQQKNSKIVTLRNSFRVSYKYCISFIICGSKYQKKQMEIKNGGL